MAKESDKKRADEEQDDEHRFELKCDHCGEWVDLARRGKKSEKDFMKLKSAVGHIRAGRRKTLGTGNPAQPAPCPFCGKVQPSISAMMLHQKNCTSKPKVLRRLRKEAKS